MIAQGGCKAVRYNGLLVADDLVSCCPNCILGWHVCNFPGNPDAMKDVWVGLSLLEGLQVTS